MLVVGLTGGIASGKSTVLEMLEELGARIIDLDELSRDVVLPGNRAWHDIVDRFGKGILNEDGTIDREALGGIVFEDPCSRGDLEKIIHPRVFERQMEILREIKGEAPRSVVVIDVPLLIEFGLQQRMDVVVLVYAPREAQLRRLMRRNGLSNQRAEARLNSQLLIDEKMPFADFVVDNSGDLKSTRQQVKRLMGQLRKMEGTEKRSLTADRFRS